MMTRSRVHDIFQYIEKDETDKLKESIKELNLYDINNLIKNNAPALHHAILYRRHECMEILLNAGYNPNIRNQYFQTSLEWALEFVVPSRIKYDENYMKTLLILIKY